MPYIDTKFVWKYALAEENRSVQVNLRLPPSLKEAAEEAARQDHRSLASLIVKLLADHLRSEAWSRPTIFSMCIKTIPI